VAVVASGGRIDSEAALGLVTLLGQAGHEATILERSSTKIDAFWRGKLRELRLHDNVDHLLIAQIGKSSVAASPVAENMTTARFNLAIKIFTAGGQPVASFDASQPGTGFSEETARSQAKSRAFEDAIRQVEEWLLEATVSRSARE